MQRHLIRAYAAIGSEGCFVYFTELLFMKSLHIITPVKDSIDLTLKTAKAVLDSHLTVPFTYTIYNDFSTPENTARLEEASRLMGFNLVNLADITSTPSPNYLLVLKTTRRLAIDADAGLLIVESDVVVEPDTLQGLYDGAMERSDCGIAASITVDAEGAVNYPYGFAKAVLGRVEPTRKHCSFCCSLLTPNLLRAFDFDLLNREELVRCYYFARVGEARVYQLHLWHAACAALSAQQSPVETTQIYQPIKILLEKILPRPR